MRVNSFYNWIRIEVLICEVDVVAVHDSSKLKLIIGANQRVQYQSQ